MSMELSIGTCLVIALMLIAKKDYRLMSNRIRWQRVSELYIAQLTPKTAKEQREW